MKKKQLIILVMCLFLSGCLPNPALNHSESNDFLRRWRARNAEEEQEKQKECEKLKIKAIKDQQEIDHLYIGLSEREALSLLSTPKVNGVFQVGDINQTTSVLGVHRQIIIYDKPAYTRAPYERYSVYRYKNMLILYFENGKLTAWQQ